MAKKVTCKLPNASDNIGGIPFESNEDGTVSAVVTDEQAARFESIPGYEVEDSDVELDAEKVTKEPKGKKTKDPSAAPAA